MLLLARTRQTFHGAPSPHPGPPWPKNSPPGPPSPLSNPPPLPSLLMSSLPFRPAPGPTQMKTDGPTRPRAASITPPRSSSPLDPAGGEPNLGGELAAIGGARGGGGSG